MENARLMNIQRLFFSGTELGQNGIGTAARKMLGLDAYYIYYVGTHFPV